jgi:hypothetical protein
MHKTVKFADVVHLSISRLADPVAAGIERPYCTGADKSAPHHMKVLRTHRLARAESDSSDFLALRWDFNPRRD